MSDSFADLWTSSAPSNSKSPQMLGAAKQQTTIPQRSQDAFSVLSASQPTSRTHSPQVTGPITQPRNPVPAGGARHLDAFSGLFSGSLADGRNNNVANMTMAERAAVAQRAKLQQAQAPPRVTAPLPSAWDGLDSLVRQSTPSHPSPSHSPQIDFDFSAFASSTTTVKSPVGDDDRNLSDSTASQLQSTSQKKPAGTLWDLDDFDSSSHSNSPIPPRSRTPGDFDFGDREDGLLETYFDDNSDDILGDLARPVDAIKPSSRNQSTRATPSPQAPQSQRLTSRPVSPPPHIVGQIVEMGFSPQQARIALAATDTGLDVQAALETLLANGAGNFSITSPSPHDYEVRPPPQRLPNRRVNSHQDRDREVPRGTEPDVVHQSPDLNVQAEKIIAQASEIGISVFNRANAFWKESKEKAQRLYEERANAGRAGAGTQRGDGRPRWISDEVSDRAGAEQPDRRMTDGFKDDDQNPLPTIQSGRQDRPARQAPSQPVESSSRSRPKEVDLLSSEAPVYQSPFRRSRPTPQSQPPAPSRPAPAPSPPKPQRVLVSASPSALSTSASHKAAGTSAYKLGQYANAESAYSLAIAALPASHIFLVPLHNNRALARLKTGETHGAIEDCASVIEIVGGDRGIIEGIDLGDALVKAWRRRAEACEGREKWEDARKDWESVAGAAWAPSNVRAEGARGAGRCRRMLNSNPDEDTPVPKPKAKPKAPSVKPAPTPFNSVALKTLRAATSAAEAEDNERYELKDSVDARLTAWKGGKETNIRALIASLDSVLWPELGWQKVGMHELVSNAQVKSRYTRAIARVHPDKLNARNTTVEQRMIANGVFGALNEAWNAFQQ